MQKLIVLSVFIFIVLLVSLNFYLESRYYVCPDGKLVDFNFQCGKYFPQDDMKFDIRHPKADFINIDSAFSDTYKIIPGGKINLTFVLRTTSVHVGFDPMPYSSYESEYKKNFEPDKSIYSFGFSQYDIVPDLINGKSYYSIISVPKIPGHYILYLGNPSSEIVAYGVQQIYAIGPTNETLAYAIVDRHMFVSFGTSSSMIRHWKTLSKNAIDKGTFYEIFMENSFDFCDTDQRAPICESKTVSGKFLISKETGQIIG